MTVASAVCAASFGPDEASYILYGSPLYPWLRHVKGQKVEFQEVLGLRERRESLEWRRRPYTSKRSKSGNRKEKAHRQRDRRDASRCQFAVGSGSTS